MREVESVLVEEALYHIASLAVREDGKWDLRLRNGDVVVLGADELVSFRRTQASILRCTRKTGNLFPEMSSREWTEVLKRAQSKIKQPTKSV